MARDIEAAARYAAMEAQERLAAKMQGLANLALATRSTGFRVPTLDSDPGVDFPTNLWGFDDGRLRWRGTDGTVHEFLPATGQRAAIPTLADATAQSRGYKLWFNGGSGELRGELADGSVVRYAPVVADTSTDGGEAQQGSGTSTKPKISDPRPTKRRDTYKATWGRSYDNHGKHGGNRLTYGTFPGSLHTEQRIMLGFNDAAMRADLAGASILRVEYRHLNTHAWWNGADIRFGTHRASAAADNYGANRVGVFTRHWPKVGLGGGTGGWRTIPRWLGAAFRDDSASGLTIDQPTAGTAHYGELDLSSVELRITYVK